MIAASTILDGKGSVLHDKRIVVEHGKITRIDTAAVPIDYDLRGLTLLPGWIDTHVHITYHFGPNGKFQDRNETPQQAELAIAGNAWVTLMNGFTTVQSVGAPGDIPLRDAIAKGSIPGPRILTAVRPLFGRGPATGTPEEIREYIRQVKAQGADLVKIFASDSIRVGGNPTLSQEQLNAACGEAKKLGLRTLVHAYRDSVRMATLAGCTQVEHGTYATLDDLKLMASHGTYFDPQAGLVDENYLLFKDKYLGVGNYTEEGFKLEQESIPLDHELFRQAMATKGLKIVFGTDAVAGAHGRNAGEFHRPGARLRSIAHGCDGRSEFARGGIAESRRPDRLPQSWDGCGFDRPRRQSARRHYCCSPGCLRYEIRNRLQERGPFRHSPLRRRHAVDGYLDDSLVSILLAVRGKFSNTWPPFMTNTARLAAVTSCRGLPSKATISACMPGASEPI